MRLERAAEWLQPSRWTVRWVAVVVQLLKILGWLELVGGVIYAIAVASSDSAGFGSLTSGQRDTVGVALGVGALSVAALWWWLAYVLQSLLALWRLSAVEALRR